MSLSGYIWILIIPVALAACKRSAAQSGTGISGKVLWFEGNLMPGPDTDIPEGLPVEREVWIYEATPLSKTSNTPPLFTNIESELVTKVKSDSTGNFQTSLPPGKYSLFTKEENGFFANRMDGENIINPVTVEAEKSSHIIIRIDYKAAY